MCRGRGWRGRGLSWWRGFWARAWRCCRRVLSPVLVYVLAGCARKRKTVATRGKWRWGTAREANGLRVVLMTDRAKKPRGENCRRDPWELNEVVRARRVRDDAKRPMAVNLAEGLALSEFMSRFKGAARR